MRISQAEFMAMQARIDASRKKPAGPETECDLKEVGKGGIQDKIEEWLKSQIPNVWYEVKRTDKRVDNVRAGIPDYLICWKGQFVGIECKAKNGKPTLAQLGELQWLALAGAKTCIAYSPEQAIEFLKSL
jgi:hypothetical protein